METYRIIFKGEVMPAKDIAAVKASIARTFKLESEQVQELFSGKSVSVKRGLDRVAARTYMQAFERAGAYAYVVGENGLSRVRIASPARPDMEARTTTRRGGPVPMVCPNCGQEQPLSISCACCGWTSPGWSE